MLQVERLTKRFGGLTAVDDLSFTVEEGEIVGLIGPNGSGKTTVFNCIMGIYDVTDGAIGFAGAGSSGGDRTTAKTDGGAAVSVGDGDGDALQEGMTDITDYKTHEVVNEGIARVSQESNPIDLYPVAGNIKLFTLPNSVFSLYGGASDEEIYEYAARVGLEDKLEEVPGELPHADVRRLEVAKALATEPDLLLLDEPFAGMNQQEITQLRERFESFRDEGMTMIVVDHNMSGLMRLVDRTIVLHNGSKLAEGVPEEIVENEAVQDAYLAGEGI